jgi:hypothetical protein
MRTQNGSFLVLDAPLFADIVGNAQKDDGIVFGGKLARVKSPDDGKAMALMDVERSTGKLRLHRRKREILARHGI